MFLAAVQRFSHSVWPATLAHATVNAVGGLPLLLLKDVDSVRSGVAWSPVGILLLALASPFLLRNLLRPSPAAAGPS